MSKQETGTGENREKYVDLVFEGGGVKGIALVGAFSVLEERGYEPQNMAGASAGAIVLAKDPIVCGRCACGATSLVRSSFFRRVFILFGQFSYRG